MKIKLIGILLCLIAILNFGCASNQATMKKELNVMENFNEENRVVFSPEFMTIFQCKDNFTLIWFLQKK